MRTTGLPGGTHAVAFSYDADDELRLSSIRVGTETPTAYTYDNDGLLTSAGPLTLTRNADTGLAETATVGVVETTFSPNAFGEPASIDTEWGSDALNFAFQYDLNGRIQSRTESSLTGGSEQQVYVHDDAGRLTDVFIDGSPTPTYHYEYDANGNRIAWQTPTSSCSTDCVEIDEQDRLLRYDTTTFTYNDFGQLTSKTEGTDVTQYTYDELGNLRQVDLPDGRVITYLIDGMNRRVGRLVDGVATNYWVYQDALNPVAQLDGAGNVEQIYVYGSKAHVPDLIIEPGARTLSVVTDQVGSVRRVVDVATGTIAQSVDYTPFGVLESSSAEPGFDQPFRFAGGLYDAEVGLIRLGARDYDSEVARWTTSDPIRFAGRQTNLYVYAGSNPVSYLDIDGLERDFWLDAANWLDAHGVDDFAAGFGDTISFGATGWLREATNINDSVDTCSSAFGAGVVAAHVHALLSFGAGLARTSRALPGNGDIFREALRRGGRVDPIPTPALPQALREAARQKRRDAAGVARAFAQGFSAGASAGVGGGVIVTTTRTEELAARLGEMVGTFVDGILKGGGG